VNKTRHRGARHQGATDVFVSCRVCGCVFVNQRHADRHAIIHQRDLPNDPRREHQLILNQGWKIEESEGIRVDDKMIGQAQDIQHRDRPTAGKAYTPPELVNSTSSEIRPLPVDQDLSVDTSSPPQSTFNTIAAEEESESQGLLGRGVSEEEGNELVRRLRKEEL
jgi:hypothetical protein